MSPDNVAPSVNDTVNVAARAASNTPKKQTPKSKSNLRTPIF